MLAEEDKQSSEWIERVRIDDLLACQELRWQLARVMLIIG